MLRNKFIRYLTVTIISFSFCGASLALAEDNIPKEEQRKKNLEELQTRFEWWPTDAKPGPVKDPDKGGYWWWPKEPGKMRPWGNRGYVYVYKIIFDYKEDELPPPKPAELRPSLLIRKIIKNVKVYFDFDKADLRDDTIDILDTAVTSLNKNPASSILITGNCDIRGSESYNTKLGKERAATVKNFMLNHGVSEERIKIISRGKLDAVAPVTDLVGMQKDRNAQFMVAEVEEVMMPAAERPREVTTEDMTEAKDAVNEEGAVVVEEEKSVEGEIQVSTREYIVKKGDTLWEIAEKELGGKHRWKYLYEINKAKIKNPDKLRVGTKLIIPVE